MSGFAGAQTTATGPVALELDRNAETATWKFNENERAETKRRTFAATPPLKEADFAGLDVDFPNDIENEDGRSFPIGQRHREAASGRADRFERPQGRDHIGLPRCRGRSLYRHVEGQGSRCHARDLECCRDGPRSEARGLAVGRLLGLRRSSMSRPRGRRTRRRVDGGRIGGSTSEMAPSGPTSSSAALPRPVRSPLPTSLTRPGGLAASMSSRR
jgi:hypothetical protein